MGIRFGFIGIMTDPMEIIYEPSMNIVANYAGMDLDGLFYLLRAIGIVICLIAITWSLITLLFIENPQQYQETKTEITHKVSIVVLIGSIIWLFNLVKSLLDIIFS